jgi:hypothetical protein
MKNVFLLLAFFVITPVAFLFCLVLTLFFYRNHITSDFIASNKVAYAALPTTQNNFSVSITQQDGRVEKIRQFFESYHSPLEPFANDIVMASDEFGLDYRLVPAIAMQESNLCKKIPEDSHNCWGFGIYGKTVTKFPDYHEAIYTVTKTLATKYKEKGLITPDEIMTKWTPSSDGSWAFSVHQFMDALQ